MMTLHTVFKDRRAEYAPDPRSPGRPIRLCAPGRPTDLPPVARRRGNAPGRAARGEFQKDLAAEFGISRLTVLEIVHRRAWAHLPEASDD